MHWSRRGSITGLAVLWTCTAGICQTARVVRLPLNSGWSFRALADASHTGVAEWHAATVPGEVDTDLQTAGLIPDPFSGDNEKRLQWIGEEDWEYRTHIHADRALLSFSHLEVVFEGLDTFADVELNGRPLLSADNMFRSWRADVRPLLHAGDNELRVVFHSPYRLITPVVSKLPYVLPGSGYEAYDPQRGVYPIGQYIRTAGYEYGWDWGPKFVTMGLWRPVHLEAWDDARITQLHVEQDSVTAERALLMVKVDVEAAHAETIDLNLAMDALGKTAANGLRVSSLEKLDAGVNHLLIPLRVEHPRRWFPAGYGAQDRYQVTAIIAARGTGKRIDRAQEVTGLRSVELKRQPDEWGTSFTFVINGIPIFAKGANVVPMDSFPGRVTEQRERALLTAARDANMNMVRMWGGGYYQTDSFYSIADELGLMVWQDFAFGGGLVPGDKDFQENVRVEAIEQVRRLRDHPAIVLWCGNNEVETSWDSWGDRQKFKQTLTPDQRERVWQDYVVLFRDVLKAAVAAEGGGVPYWPSTPGANFEERANNPDNGDMHFWDVWSGKAPVDAYSAVQTRFLSEYGFQGMPDLTTVRSFAGDEESLTAPPLSAHERFVKGFDRMQSYLRQEVGEPRDFASFDYLSQYLQAEAVRLAAEHLRSMMPRTMGSLYWQLNDCWPVVSWSSIDYYGRPKALQYYARHFYAPQLIAPEFANGKLSVHLVSDSIAPLSGELTMRIFNLNGQMLKQLRHEVIVPALSSIEIEPLDTAAIAGFDAESSVAVLEWNPAGRQIVRRVYFFTGRKPGKLSPPKIETSIARTSDGYALDLKTDVVARAVEVSFRGVDAQLDDNFVDLLPGEPVRLRLHSREPLAKIKEALRIETLATALQR